jgi:hypothetical protein
VVVQNFRVAAAVEDLQVVVAAAEEESLDWLIQDRDMPAAPCWAGMLDNESTIVAQVVGGILAVAGCGILVVAGCGILAVAGCGILVVAGCGILAVAGCGILGEEVGYETLVGQLDPPPSSDVVVVVPYLFFDGSLHRVLARHR